MESGSHSVVASTNEPCLWVDKYRPQKLKDLTLHPEITEQMGKLVRSHFW
jgi:hypothetical protein